MNDFRIPLRIVLYREDGEWIAHCLEFDLLGNGETKGEALETLKEAMQLQVAESLRYDNPANLFSPASGEMFELFSAGMDCDVSEYELDLQSLSQAPVVIDSVQLREFDRHPAPSAVS